MNIPFCTSGGMSSMMTPPKSSGVSARTSSGLGNRERSVAAAMAICAASCLAKAEHRRVRRGRSLLLPSYGGLVPAPGPLRPRTRSTPGSDPHCRPGWRILKQRCAAAIPIAEPDVRIDFFRAIARAAGTKPFACRRSPSVAQAAWLNTHRHSRRAAPSTVMRSGPCLALTG